MAEPEFTILQIAHIDETGDSYHRMRWPAATLAEKEPNWRVVNLHWTAKERYELALHADLLVLFQCADPFMLRVIEERRALGRKTLVEYNDNFYEPTPSSPVSESWSDPTLWQTYESFLEAADGLIVTGDGLKKLFSEKTDTPIYILKNNYHHTQKPFPELWESKGEKIKFGWAGSLGHYADVMACRDLISEILNDYPEVTFSFMGNDELFRDLRLNNNRIEYHPWASMQQYLQFWEGAHIGFAPMLDHPYNHCRSDIKAIEMSASGAVPLVSTVGPYREYLKESGLKGFSSLKELDSRLRELLDDPSLARKQANKAYNYVQRDRLAKNRDERRDLYRDFLVKNTSTPLSLNFKSGYYELRGTREETQRREQVLEAVREFNNRNESVRSIELLLRNGIDRDLLLRGIRMLTRVNPPLAQQQMEIAISRYPLDLRFLFLFVQTTRSHDACSSGWQRIIRVLEEQGDTFLRYYGKTIVQVFTRSLRRIPAIEPYAEKLLEMYPSSVELMVIVAKRYEILGEIKKANRYFKEALNIIDQLSMNTEISVTREVVASWGLACQASEDNFHSGKK